MEKEKLMLWGYSVVNWYRAAFTLIGVSAVAVVVWNLFLVGVKLITN